MTTLNSHLQRQPALRGTPGAMLQHIRDRAVHRQLHPTCNSKQPHEKHAECKMCADDAAMRRCLLVLDGAGFATSTAADDFVPSPCSYHALTTYVSSTSSGTVGINFELSPYRAAFWNSPLSAADHVNLLIEDAEQLGIEGPVCVSLRRNDTAKVYHALVRARLLSLTVRVPYSELQNVRYLPIPPALRPLYIVLQDFVRALADETVACYEANKSRLGAMERLENIRSERILSELLHEAEHYRDLDVLALAAAMRPIRGDHTIMAMALCRLEPERLLQKAIHVDLVLSSAQPEKVHEVITCLGSPAIQPADWLGIASPSTPAYVASSRSSIKSTTSSARSLRREAFLDTGASKSPNLDVLHGQRAELLETERNYVEKLNMLCCVFKAQLIGANIRSKFMDPLDISALFVNTDILLLLNSSFLHQLEDAMAMIDEQESWSALADAVHKHAIRCRREYEQYLAGHELNLLKIREILRNNRGFRRALHQVSLNSAIRGWKLQELLAEPFQRIPRYLLMIERILRHLPMPAEDEVNDEDHSWNKLSRACEMFDATARVSKIGRWAREGRLDYLVENVRGCSKRIMVEDNYVLGFYRVREQAMATASAIERGQLPSFIVLMSKYLLLIGCAPGYQFAIDTIKLDQVELLYDATDAHESVVYLQHSMVEDKTGPYWRNSGGVHALSMDPFDLHDFQQRFLDAQAVMSDGRNRGKTYRHALDDGRTMYFHIYNGLEAFERSKLWHRDTVLVWGEDDEAGVDMVKRITEFTQATLFGVIQSQENRGYRCVLRAGVKATPLVSHIRAHAQHSPPSVASTLGSDFDGSFQTYAAQPLELEADAYRSLDAFVPRLVSELVTVTTRGIRNTLTTMRARFIRNQAMLEALLQYEEAVAPAPGVFKGLVRRIVRRSRPAEASESLVEALERVALASEEECMNRRESGASSDTIAVAVPDNPPTQSMFKKILPDALRRGGRMMPRAV